MSRAIMTVEQAAEYLQVTPKTMHRWLREGKVPGAKLARNVWRIPRAALDEWIARRSRLRTPRPPDEGLDLLDQTDDLRQRIRQRRGEPLPDGTGLHLLRQSR